LAAPTSGTATVLGKKLGDVAVRARIGFLPEHFRFYDWLTGAELLRLHGRLYRIPETILPQRCRQLLELVGLAPHSSKPLRQYSKGMLQRVGLAQALLNQPELIFLDEPTSGLDPAGRILVRDIIRAQRQRGATVFLNSHLLGEVEVSCDRVAFVKNGSILQVRSLADEGNETASVSMRVGNLKPEVLACLEQRVGPVKGPVKANAGLLTFEAATADIPQIIRFLVEHSVDVYSCTPQRLSLEDLFMQIVGADGGL
jgi:ABC-2 type transport system ATP-binding protein